MTAPPGRQPTTKPTGGLVSENAAHAAAALRRAGRRPTPALIRQVLRAQRATGEAAPTEFDWWDRLVRSLPLGLSRQRTAVRRGWAVTS